ncbi:hypothetical protein EJ06DRAFT_515055 [Trichodelitschia bisporula]|uniref:C2H2-type domain-containing protein n=1 Tax=Trichodelitschia bisporula TaxID=703511 RepID=A0A6G1HNZ2_9PEZI|nr:hypothetical protein EJ06DRAFT_515055 [Trichodelitschia bisporula]
MSDATTTNTGTNGDNLAQPLSPRVVSTSYMCTSCHISFENSQEQRIHMKSPWHVANIKRRIALLPPLSHDEFGAQAESEKKPDSEEARPSNPDKQPSTPEAESKTEAEDPASPFDCLFCNQNFQPSGAGLTSNIEHMSMAHGLTIPEPESVVDMQSFIGYLATEVRTWHECLYCGATKPSTASIQSHMRDKGHCTLNFDREPELFEFWEGMEDENGSENEDELSATELLTASGRVIGSRQTVSAAKKARRQSSTRTIGPLLASGAEAPLPPMGARSSGRQLARREEMGLVGVSPLQRQALVLAEKKAQRSEAVARRAREWAYARSANVQEFDQIDTKGKWGKQNHKLLPR